MRKDCQALGFGHLPLQDHRRRKVAVYREDRRIIRTGHRAVQMGVSFLPALSRNEDPASQFRLEIQYFGVNELLAVLPQHTDCKGNPEWTLRRLAGGGRRTLAERQIETVAVQMTGDGNAGRTGLVPPAFEAVQFIARDFSEAGEEVIDRSGLAVMALEIRLKRLFVGRVAHKRLQHANYLGTLFVDGCGVEIVDLDVAFRPNGMRKRAVVLPELP